jgi:hypothetical protein
MWGLAGCGGMKYHLTLIDTVSSISPQFILVIQTERRRERVLLLSGMGLLQVEDAS